MSKDTKGGFISIHRDLREHWLFQEKRQFSRFEAWIDLLYEVNWKDKKVPVGNELIDCKRGQTITSIKQLCDRWGWSNTKVYNFLDLMQENGSLVYESDTKKTMLTIVNYNSYQEQNTSKTKRKRNQSETEAKQKHTNNNINKDNKNITYSVFEKVWSIYPSKKGKARVNKKSKEHLEDIGVDEMERALSRYKQEVFKNRNSGFEQNYQNGSTWFNTSYLDYLDANFEGEEKEKPRKRNLNMVFRDEI